ncbi:glycosyl hydrolase [Kitasatospora sp. NPDC097691]|uniref:glycosyl hydrolase n=1 Tax=Kitasatospora sp. NPDC097691 TaxID=3157231 RepID=UPI0033236631
MVRLGLPRRCRDRSAAELPPGRPRPLQKKPIWLTEYALIDFSGGTPRYPTPEQQAAFVAKSTAMLQGLPFVERYAWFTLSADRGGTGLYNRATPNRVGAAYRAAG